MKVYGIDIIRGSVRSRSRRPTYALVRMAGDVIVSESDVTGFRLFRILSAEKPDILAVDSLQEISVDQHDLFSFLQALPPSVRLVQVTGGEKKETLGKVASRYNISFNRFDPFDEARTIARVATLGAGAEVIAFENMSDVVVSRHRSPGKGGWSQNRYVRKIHGAVQQKAREIEMEIIASGLKYEKKRPRPLEGAAASRLWSMRRGTGSRFQPIAVQTSRCESAAKSWSGYGSGRCLQNLGISLSGSIPVPPRRLRLSISTGTFSTFRVHGRCHCQT